MSELDEIRARWAGRQWAPYGKQVVAPPGSIDCPSNYTSARILAQTSDPAISHVISQAPADVNYLSGEVERLRTALEQIANPIGYLQAEAAKEGAKLDGAMAVLIESMPSWYREHARKALLPDANQVGGNKPAQIVDAGDL